MYQARLNVLLLHCMYWSIRAAFFVFFSNCQLHAKYHLQKVTRLEMKFTSNAVVCIGIFLNVLLNYFSLFSIYIYILSGAETYLFSGLALHKYPE